MTICAPNDLTNIFADVGFDRVTLSTVESVDPARVENENHPDGKIELKDLTTQVSISCYLRERVSADAASWYQQGDILNYLRLRVLVCVADRNPAGLDYISQRFNEYQDLQGKFVRNGVESVVPPRTFINRSVSPNLVSSTQQLNGENITLRNNSYILNQSETGLYMPYQSADPTIFLKNNVDVKTGYEAYKPGSNHRGRRTRERARLRDIIVFDKTLAEVLPQRINPETGEFEVVSRSIRATTPANEELGRPTMVLFEQAPLLPIEFRLGPDTDIDYILGDSFSEGTLDQLSIYGFVYLDYKSYQEDHGVENPQGSEKVTLETGVGKTTYLNLIGKKYIYQNLNQDTESTPRNLLQILDAPDAGILQDLRLGRAPRFSTETQNYYQDAYRNFDGSALAKDPTGQLIHREDFFTDFWATPDFKNNTRYLIGFNLIKFLAQKSQFPGLYMLPQTAERLTRGGVSFRFKDSDETGVYRSELKDFRVGKRHVDPSSFYNYNDLGTLSAKKPRPEDHNYEETFLRHPRAANFNILSSRENNSDYNPGNIGYYFYEGTDYYEDNRISMSEAEYQYFCEVTVTDNAPIFLLKATREIQSAAENVKRLLNHVLDPIYGVYDPIVNKFKIFLINFRYQNTNARDYIFDQLNVYMEYLRLFGIRIDLPNNPDFGLLQFEESLRQQIDFAQYAEDIEIIIRYMDTFANDIAALANVYYNVQMGYQEEADFAKRDALVKGIYEHEFGVLTYRHYFDETYNFGIKNRLGYSYVPANDDEVARLDMPDPDFGIGIFSAPQYVDRITDELNKYYYRTDKVGSPITLDIVPQEWSNSLYKYLTPKIISGQNGPYAYPPLVQTKEQTTNVLDYDIDRYASLLGDLFQSKYATKYLNYVFYQNNPELPNDHPNVQLYNSLLKTLGQEFSCEINTDLEPLLFDPPKVKRYSDQDQSSEYQLPGEETVARGALDPGSIFNPQGVIGGRGDQSDATQAIIEGIQQRYADEKKNAPDKEDPKYMFGGKQSPELPIKLTFGILGEIELNNTFDGLEYQMDPFNSMNALAEILTVSPASLPTDLTGRYRDLPFQLKAMLVMATMTQRVNINGMSVKRFKAQDHDPVEDSINAIKYYDDRANMGIHNPPYKDLYDPMKTYAKFLAFWLNFKQVIKVEYLHSFDRLNAPVTGLHPSAGEVINLNSPGRPVWKELTREGFREMTTDGGGKILCRIAQVDPKRYDDGDAMENLINSDPDTSGIGLDQPGVDNIQIGGNNLLLQKAFEKNKSLELPIYHSYFFLGDEEGVRQ